MPEEKSMATQGLILVLVGPAGVGKDTITEFLLVENGFQRFVILTTRPPRPGEVSGAQYRFVSEEVFQKAADAGELFNDIVVGGCRYGIQLSEMKKAFARSGVTVVHLVHEWAMKMKQVSDRVVVVMIKAPSRDMQIWRLEHRGEDKPTIKRRMADDFVQNPPEEGCDLIVVNQHNQADLCADQIIEYLRTKM
jgi:guanylate kinase